MARVRLDVNRLAPDDQTLVLKLAGPRPAIFDMFEALYILDPDQFDAADQNKPLIGKFVKVTQHAFAECVKDPKPCVQALIDANGALSFDNELVNWQLVEVLMSDKISRGVALGWHDDARMKADYELVRDYIGIDKPFDVKSTYTNEFLDKSIKMTEIKPPL